jgi:cell division protein FtsL
MSATKLIAVAAVCILAVVGAVLFVMFVSYLVRELVGSIHVQRTRKTPAEYEIELASLKREERIRRIYRRKDRLEDDKRHIDLRRNLRYSMQRLEWSSARLDQSIGAA